MNVKHTLQIAMERLQEAVAAVRSGPQAGTHGNVLRLAPGLRVQYCLNTDDRAWNLPAGERTASRDTTAQIWHRLQGASFDILWMAPLITSVVFLWVRLGLAASGIWPLF
jgi:hypothetical protein